MAEKKKGLSIEMIVASIAVGAAAGVIYYHRKAQLKKLAEDIIARVRPAAAAPGADEEPGDWDIRSGAGPEGAEAADVNIVDSGVSLESVEAETDGEAEEPAPEAGAEPEAEADADAEPEAEADEDEDDIERPKKPWFWSK